MASPHVPGRRSVLVTAWAVVAAWGLPGCGEAARGAPGARVRGTGDAAVAPDVPAPASVAQVGIEPGERFAWHIQAGGVVLARFELVAGASEIRIRLATSTLVRSFARIDHELVTSLRDGHAVAAHERFAIDERVGDRELSLDGTGTHSLHTALGALRRWAHGDATPQRLDLRLLDLKLELTLAGRTRLGRAVRVDGELSGLARPMNLKVWLDEAGRFARIELRAGLDLLVATPAV